MDDQSHIFQLLFQEQIDDYKQSLTSIDDLFEQKKEQPVTITVSYFLLTGNDLFSRNQSTIFLKKEIFWQIKIFQIKVLESVFRRIRQIVLQTVRQLSLDF